MESTKTFTYGSNQPDYNDKKIGYDYHLRAFYLIHKMSDSSYMITLLKSNGTVIFTSSQSPEFDKIVDTNGHIENKVYLNNAINHFMVCFDLLSIILSVFYRKFEFIEFVGTNTYATRRIEQYIRNGKIKQTLAKYGFNLKEYSTENNKNSSFKFSKD